MSKINLFVLAVSPASCVKLTFMCVLAVLLADVASAQRRETPTLTVSPSPQASINSPRTAEALQRIVDEAARTTLARFATGNLRENNLAITLIDLTDRERPLTANFRGEERMYSASVVKMYYLMAVHRWLEDGRLRDSPELRRAVRDMIVDSSNDATHYVLDALTGTTSGVELPPAQMRRWEWQRNAVNRYFTSLGYRNINVNQKTYCEDAYGRERVFRRNGTNRNMLTTNATARLLMEIATLRAVNEARSREMMELLQRDPYAPVTSGNTDDQSHGFTGIALREVPGARLWSKAGWTSTTRHDAAYIELPNGARFVLVTFTTDNSRERQIIPTVARYVINALGANNRSE
jgi:beta-lactamase class A